MCYRGKENISRRLMQFLERLIPERYSFLETKLRTQNLLYCHMKTGRCYKRNAGSYNIPFLCFLNLYVAHGIKSVGKGACKTSGHVLNNQYGKIYIFGEFRQKHLKGQRSPGRSSYSYNINEPLVFLGRKGFYTLPDFYRFV